MRDGYYDHPIEDDEDYDYWDDGSEGMTDEDWENMYENWLNYDEEQTMPEV